MSAPVKLMEPLAEVLNDLNVELSSAYTMRWRGRWPWLVRHGRQLYVDLLPAADFFDLSGKRKVAARLRARAERLHSEMTAQNRLRCKLMEGVGQ